MMARRWTESEETAVRLAAALYYEDGGQRLPSLLTGSAGPRRRSGSGRRGCARFSSGRRRVATGRGRVAPPHALWPLPCALLATHEPMSNGGVTRAALIENVAQVAGPHEAARRDGHRHRVRQHRGRPDRPLAGLDFGRPSRLVDVTSDSL